VSSQKQALLDRRKKNLVVSAHSFLTESMHDTTVVLANLEMLVFE